MRNSFLLPSSFFGGFFGAKHTHVARKEPKPSITEHSNTPSPHGCTLAFCRKERQTSAFAYKASASACPVQTSPFGDSESPVKLPGKCGDAAGAALTEASTENRGPDSKWPRLKGNKVCSAHRSISKAVDSREARRRWSGKGSSEGTLCGMRQAPLRMRDSKWGLREEQCQQVQHQGTEVGSRGWL